MQIVCWHLGYLCDDFTIKRYSCETSWNGNYHMHYHKNIWLSEFLKWFIQLYLLCIKGYSGRIQMYLILHFNLDFRINHYSPFLTRTFLFSICLFITSIFNLISMKGQQLLRDRKIERLQQRPENYMGNTNLPFLYVYPLTTNHELINSCELKGKLLS